MVMTPNDLPYTVEESIDGEIITWLSPLPVQSSLPLVLRIPLPESATLSEASSLYLISLLKSSRKALKSPVASVIF